MEPTELDIALNALYPLAIDHWYDSASGMEQMLTTPASYLELWAVHHSGISALYLAHTPALALHGHFIEMSMGLVPLHVYRGDQEDIDLDQYITV